MTLAIYQPTVLPQDATKTTYHTGYRGVCRASILFPDEPPFRYWCRLPNGRAIQVPIDPAHIKVITNVSVCALERLTRREDDAPCGFASARLLWGGRPNRNIELSNPGVSFGNPPTEPDDIYGVVSVNWVGTFPAERNLFSVRYAFLSRALRRIKVRLAGKPSEATLTPSDTAISIGGSGYIKLLAALKSKNALWLQMGQVRLVGQGRSYFLRTGKAQKVPGGSYKILTNGYLPEGDGLGFLEVDLEYETGQ